MNHSNTPPAHQVDAHKMMALSDAEHLAYQRAGTTVVVYARTTPPPQGAWTTSDSLHCATGHPMAEGAATKRAGSDSFPKAKPTRVVVGGNRLRADVRQPGHGLALAKLAGRRSTRYTIAY